MPPPHRRDDQYIGHFYKSIQQVVGKEGKHNVYIYISSGGAFVAPCACVRMYAQTHTRARHYFSHLNPLDHRTYVERLNQPSTVPNTVI